MAVVTVSCVVAVVAGPRIGPLNIRGHHVSRGGAASNNHWREIGMEYLDDDGAPLAVTLTSALTGGGARLLAKASQRDDAGPGDPINPLGALGHAFTGQSKFALATSGATPSKAASADPPSPPSPPMPSMPARASSGIQSFVAPTDPPPGPPDPGPPDPGPPDPGPPIVEPPPQNPPTPIVVVTVVPPPSIVRPPPAAAPPALPEPGTWALMVLGLGAVGATLRRRRGIQMRVGARAA